MTKVQIRFGLAAPLDEQMMGRIAEAHSIYGIMRVASSLSANAIVVEYDASRLRREDVEAALKRRGIPVGAEK